MTESKHTPGPWIVFNGDGSFGVLPAGRPGVIAECTNTHDASLIAAAPKLLAACKTLIECATIADKMLTAVGKEHREITVAIELARKFVAQAEGQS
jgi:hypothetical protein